MADVLLPVEPPGEVVAARCQDGAMGVETAAVHLDGDVTKRTAQPQLVQAPQHARRVRRARVRVRGHLRARAHNVRHTN